MSSSRTAVSMARSHLIALLAVVLSICACRAADPTADVPRSAATVDVSGLAPFWIVAERLALDETPSDDEWRAVFATPGYALMAAHDDAERTLRAMLPLALMPSRADERQELAASGDFREVYVAHLRGAFERRAEIDAFADELERRDLTSEALRLAADWLPAAALDHVAPPQVSFVILEPDARGYERIVIDIAFALALRADLTPTIAHETHHVVRNALGALALPDGDFPERGLLQALDNLEAEGIADQIDKQDFLTRREWGDEPAAQLMEWIQARYAAGYERANETLAEVDVILAAYAADPGDARDQGAALRGVLVLGGHPVGFHMARVILAVFGRAPLIEHVADPFAFVFVYSEAAARSGRGDHVFSAEALAGTARLRDRFARGPSPR